MGEWGQVWIRLEEFPISFNSGWLYRVFINNCVFFLHTDERRATDERTKQLLHQECSIDFFIFPTFANLFVVRLFVISACQTFCIIRQNEKRSEIHAYALIKHARSAIETHLWAYYSLCRWNKERMERGKVLVIEPQQTNKYGLKK